MEKILLLSLSLQKTFFQSLVFVVSGAYETCAEDTLANSAAPTSTRSPLSAPAAFSNFDRTSMPPTGSQKSYGVRSDSKAIFRTQKFAIFLLPSLSRARSPFPHNAIFAVKEAHYASRHTRSSVYLPEHAGISGMRIRVASATRGFTLVDIPYVVH